MTLAQVFFSLEGRINRKPYWVAGLFLIVLMLAVSLAGVIVIGTMTTSAMQSDTATLEMVPWITLGVTVVTLLMIYPSSAIMVKRFHDLNKSGKWTLLLVVPVLAMMATDLLGITGKPIPFDRYGFDGTESLFEAWRVGMAVEWSVRPLETLVSAFIFLVTLWFLVELGFFRGTRGPNRFGPDPIGPTPGN